MYYVYRGINRTRGEVKMLMLGEMAPTVLGAPKHCVIGDAEFMRLDGQLSQDAV